MVKRKLGDFMSYKKREWFEGAMYHITSRGNERSNIFHDDGDFEYFIALLEFVNNKYTIEIYSYCLMTNHYHLQIGTLKVPIWQIMSCINTHYSKYYNIKYKKCGHVFQKRYTSSLIKEDNYMLETSRYIHLNPVKARMVNKPSKYKWSSYRSYIKEDSKNKFIRENMILNYFEDNQRNAYKEYVEMGAYNKEIFRKIEVEME